MIKRPSGQWDGNLTLTLIFMIPRKYYKKKKKKKKREKKIFICGNISLVIALWVDILIVYIALNQISTFLRQFYPGNLANFAVGTIISSSSLLSLFHDSAKLLYCRDGTVCSSSWCISFFYFLSSFLFLFFPNLFSLILLQQIFARLVHWSILGNVFGSFFNISLRFNG